MKNHKFIQYYDHRLANFYKYYNKTLESLEMEDLHQLRVSIKKLRTMWSLIQLVSIGKWHKEEHFTCVEKLFEVAGNLRETQINLKLIEQYHAVYLFPFSEFLMKKQKHLGKQLVETMQSFDVKSFESMNAGLKKILIKFSDEITLKESAAFALEKNRKIQKIKQQLANKGKLHKIRIQLRDVHEIMSIMMRLNPDDPLSDFQSQIKKLNNEIGHWHDYLVLRKSLKHFSEIRPDNKGVRHIENLLNRILQQQKAKETELYSLIDKYITPKHLKRIQNFLIC